MQCPGAPSGERTIFEGAGTVGRFLPPPPSGFGQWDYINDTDGVYITINGNAEASIDQALAKVLNKYETCEAELNKDSCGAQCLTIWLRRDTCP